MDSNLEAEVRYVTGGSRDLATTTVGTLEFPEGSKEAQRCRDIGSILKEYSERSDKSEPLSIAVFGPPGSGKSRTVREIAKSLGGKYAEITEINLSQLSGTEDLAKAIQNGIGRKKKAKRAAKGIPILFFDEFDAPLSGVSLGWLRWFLAPMQDGQVMVESKTMTIGKAVFMFAGGTAVSLAEFQERAELDQVAYREKKVPDFISRLRGFIDIQGINTRDQELKVRRALVLRHFLRKRWPGHDGPDPFPIEEGLVRSLLSNVHFLHGTRSMEALLDMSRLKDGQVELPETQLTKLHLSRGVLDGKLIGISAGLKEGDSGAAHLLGELTEALLHNGARLAYGGDFTPEGTLDHIVRAAQRVPDDLFDRSDKRILNYLGFPSPLRAEVKGAILRFQHLIHFEELATLSSTEIKDLGLKENEWFPALAAKGCSEPYHPNQHLAWAISLYRMRVRLIQDIHALVVFGGKDGESWGRFAGIAEEVMLAIAFGKPVYIMGGLGGAANAVGKLLGLGSTIANPDECLADVKPILARCPPHFSRAFCVPNQQLPETIEEMRDFFFQSSTVGKWPWNGLTPEDNRELFCADVAADHRKSERGQCVDLIVKGLCRLEWKSPPVSQPALLVTLPKGATVESVSDVNARLGPSASEAR